MKKHLAGALLLAALRSGPATAQVTAQISGPLLADAMTIRGTVRGGTRVDIQFCDIDSGRLLDLKTGATVPSDANGAFTAALQYPLVAGQRIRLEQASSVPSPDSEPCAKMTGAVLLGPPVIVQLASEWGRVRMSFLAGTVFSNDNHFQGQSLNQASLFLDFVAEKNWLWGGVNADCASDQHPGCSWSRRWLLNTFFETRLTNVPESQQQTAASGGTVSPTDTLSTFIGSRKSALMQAGVYVPFLATTWLWQNAPQSLFVAPLAKVGFITPTDTAGTDTTSQPVNPQRFYNYYQWGVRLGHYRMSFDRNDAPELVSYVDVTMGRFSNLETLAPVLDSQGQQQVLNGQALARPMRQYRVALEGGLKVPATPLVVGFSANIGQNFSLVRHLQSANDDLRFFIGARCDLGKLLARVQQF